ncbi:hypothetical protein W97_01743 [Coniosporium apollinis CBS 100218]|uniref:Uncharacterized protein n=1 Tax=Coniosporium apollinis (strain CBS 100218) TaxID=1168221 RepID=R7YKU8_CONA1|nr:uncharacterized protein W97_01743 [Coniosporium apollinis CBS 100218]EON62520.1 hypothetical protein W97_01743 [Coniosporium apollinis CBS 100218]
MAYHQPTQSRYSQCDSYFIESDNDGIYAARAEARERTRAIARMQQRAIAEELSRATADEYQEDIMDHMEHMESETMPDVNSIDIQTEIQWFMRPYLLDFLVEAHAAFQLLPDTLFLAVNLLDRYCSRRVVYKRHYQLVGCAALLIAAKFGDRKERVPTVRELRSMCCSLYDEEMFTQMEWHVLQTLDWAIGHPTVDGFLQLALSEVPYDPEVEHMTWFICEVALFHKDFVSTRPSVLARSSLALARCILARPPVRQSQWAGTYDPATVLNLSNHLYQPSQVLARKYASIHLSSVSTTVEDFLQQQAQIARRNTPPISSVDVAQQKHNADGYLAPHTPQKSQYGSVMQHGCLTPPITPDNDFGENNYGQGHSLLPRIYPSTPTPLSNVQQGPPQYSYQQYLPPQHVH